MEIITIVKLVCLFIGVLFTIVNTARIINNAYIPAVNFVYQAIGIVGFIIIHFGLYK